MYTHSPQPRNDMVRFVHRTEVVGNERNYLIRSHTMIQRVFHSKIAFVYPINHQGPTDQHSGRIASPDQIHGFSQPSARIITAQYQDDIGFFRCFAIDEQSAHGPKDASPEDSQE